jgi:hypothetical protein
MRCDGVLRGPKPGLEITEYCRRSRGSLDEDHGKSVAASMNARMKVKRAKTLELIHPQGTL